MFCTKCGNKLKEKDNFCPNCGQEISKVVVEEAKEKVEVTKKTTEPEQNAVTPPQNQAPAPASTPTTGTNPAPFIIIGAVVIVGIIIFIFFLVFVILVGVFTAIEDYDYEYDYSGNNTITEYKDYYENAIVDVIGEWESVGGSYFVFNKNKNFFWYESKNVLTDNYYYGYLEVLKGEAALKDLGIAKEDVKKVIESSSNINYNNIYSIKLYPTYLLVEGENKTSEKIKKGDNMQLLFVKLGNGKAEAYNFKTDSTYYLEKEEDTI